MNKSKIKELFGSLIIQEHFESNEIVVLDATSNLQSTKKNSLVFYKFRDLGESSKIAFKKRLIKHPSLLVVNKDISSFYHGNFLVIKDDEFVNAQIKIANEMYPLKTQNIFGVTGTNGKTSVAYLAMQMAQIFSKDSLYIGTLGVWRNGNCVIEEINNTTPSYLELRKIISLNSSSETQVFCEVSSHALDQKRLGNIKLKKAVWTNLTQDHLDYHENMDNYFCAKAEIANYICEEDGKIFFPFDQVELKNKFESFRPETKVAFPPENIDTLGGIPDIFKSGFNKSNFELALALNEENVNNSQKYDFSKISSPLGRFTQFSYANNVVIVDYAHTPDALENILKEINILYKNKKNIVTIFGCGGDRDKTKRPLMGVIAKNLSNRVVVTSDNPRNEDPLSIIKDIIQNRFDFAVNIDRRDAILKELSLADNTVILIAGKGHEPYQEIHGIKHKYSDIELVKGFINDF